MTVTIDVGGTALKFAAFGNDNRLLEKGEQALGECGAAGMTQTITEIADRLIQRHGSPSAIAIDSAGLVDSRAGILTYAANLGITKPLRLADIIKERYKVPVFLANDVNAAAAGEMCFGAAREDSSFIFVAYGTGVGGAIVLEREIYEGQRGIAGEIGHITTHPGGLKCGCGSFGCYERYASVSALVARASKADPEITDGRTLFAKYYNGDKNAAASIDEWLEEVVLGLTSLTHLFDPSAIILGGGIMNEGFLVSEIEQRLRSAVMKEYSGVCVRHAALGNTAGMYGMLARANNMIM